jgi:hypothetical protein
MMKVERKGSIWPRGGFCEQVLMGAEFTRIYAPNTAPSKAHLPAIIGQSSRPTVVLTITSMWPSGKARTRPHHGVASWVVVRPLGERNQRAGRTS